MHEPSTRVFGRYGYFIEKIVKGTRPGDIHTRSDELRTDHQCGHSEIVGLRSRLPSDKRRRGDRVDRHPLLQHESPIGHRDEEARLRLISAGW